MLERKFRPIEEILRDEEKNYILSLPMWVVYGVGEAVIFREIYDDAHGYPTDSLLGDKFESALPSELTQKGENRFKGDMEKEIEIALNYKDVRRAGLAVMFLDQFNEGIEMLPSFLRSRFEEKKIRNLNAGKIMIESYEKSGGIKNTDILTSIEFALRKASPVAI